MVEEGANEDVNDGAASDLSGIGMREERSSQAKDPEAAR